MKIPKDVDELMWRLAETNDTESLDAFADRYPDYKGELASRIRMVRGLKGSRPKQAVTAFVPRANVGGLPAPKWALPAVGAFLLASVAFATFAVVKFLDGQRLAEPLSAGGVQVPRPARPDQQGTASEAMPQPKPTDGIRNRAGSGGDPVKSQPTKFDLPVTVVSDRMRLSEALDEIAKQAGLSLTAAPGMPDPEIKINYQDSSAILVLKDLGRNFGFTAMEEGERVCLLVPARDATGRGDASETVLTGHSSALAADEHSTKSLPPVP